MNSLLVLIAPPASGKTFWIEQFQHELREEFLFISPLRALADECKEKWGEQIIVKTPEEWISHPTFRKIVIFDEFHLYFYWGDSFRPNMWEAFYSLVSEANLVVLLTATFSEDMKRETLKLGEQFHEVIWCDQGNQKLKYKPSRYIKAPSKEWIEDILLCGPRGKAVNLVFCQYREEVYQLQKKIMDREFTAWGFVGGEAGEVAKKLSSEKHPDFIVSTTVLSHGVNLPKISTIYFTYVLKNKDFWIQMVARGGRKGEKYEVFSLEKPFDLKWNIWLNFFYVIYFSLRIVMLREVRELKKWLLKES